MAPTLSNSHWSRSGGGEGLNVLPNASQDSVTTNYKSTLKTQAGVQAKGTHSLISIIGRALEQLSLSLEECVVWDIIKSCVKELECIIANSLEL
jgi:hypothetical protein